MYLWREEKYNNGFIEGEAIWKRTGEKIKTKIKIDDSGGIMEEIHLA